MTTLVKQNKPNVESHINYLSNMIALNKFKQTMQSRFLLTVGSKLNTQDEVYIDKKDFEQVGLTLENLKDFVDFKIKVIHKCRHYDFEKEQWVGQRGYWLQKF